MIKYLLKEGVILLLYKKGEENMQIYDFCIDEEAAKEYRKKQMELIPKEKTIYTAKAYNTNGKKPVFEKYRGNLKSTVFKIHDINHPSKNHELAPAGYNYVRINEILNKFYNGDFLDGKIARVLDFNSLRYFLLTEDRYWRFLTFSNSAEMNNIIEVPESLYILQLLQQAAFPCIRDFDMTEQLELFTLKYVDDINLEDIRKMDEFGVSKGVYTKVLNKIENDSVLFEKYKK